MGASVEITLDDARIESAIQKIAGRAVKGPRLMRELSIELLGQTIDRFQDQTSPGGEAWERSQRAEAQGDRGKTLIDTGVFRNSMTAQSSDVSASAGTNAVQAAIHQLGGDAGRGKKVKLPARPYLGISKKGAVSLEDVVLDHLERL